MASVERLLEHPAWTIVFRVVATLSLLAAIVVYYQQTSFVRCIVAYNDTQAATARARAVIVQENFEAIDKMLSDVVNAPSRQAARERLLDYLQVRERADKHRIENPLPAPPSERCA